MEEKMICPDKIVLGTFPTPVTLLDNISREKGKGKIYLKRDDLSGLGGGGNKLRKLEYLAAEGKAKGATLLLTIGGPQTNHGRMTAAVAAKLNLKSVILATGPMPEGITGNVLLDGLFGSDFRVVDLDEKSLTAKEYKTQLDRAISLVSDEYEKKGEKVYFIPLGGSSPLGSMGYFFAVKEIMDQCEDTGIKIDHLVTSFGSGGTFGGLWLGARYFGAPFDVTGITVSPGMEGKQERMKGLIRDMNRLFDLGLDLSTPEIFSYDDYQGDGYNIPDRRTREVVHYLAAREGVLIDPVYTGKGFAGCLDLMEKGIFGSGNVMFLHSGGAPALHAPGHLEGFQRDFGAKYMKEVYL